MQALAVSFGTRYLRPTNIGIPVTRHVLASFADACKLVTLWRESDEYGFLADVHSQALQQALRDLDRAYINCFEGRAAQFGPAGANAQKVTVSPLMCLH